MASEIRKYLLDKFQAHLRLEFDSFCKQHGLEGSNEHLATFLIDRDLVQKADIQRYTVLKEFALLYLSDQTNKTQAVSTISHRFNISERTVWNILKHKQWQIESK